LEIVSSFTALATVAGKRRSSLPLTSAIYPALPRVGVVIVGLPCLRGAPVPEAVVHTGRAEAPPPTNIPVVAPAGSVCKAPVAVVPAAMSPYAVVEVERPVPPLGTLNTGKVFVPEVRSLFVTVSVVSLPKRKSLVAGTTTVFVPEVEAVFMNVEPEPPKPPRASVPIVNVFIPVFVCAAARIISPLPAGVAHVPSPLQKVVFEAPVPEFRFVTGRLPVTPVVRGSPVALVKTRAVGVPKAGVTRVGELARTTAPVPVLAVAASPLIENELPVPAVS